MFLITQNLIAIINRSKCCVRKWFVPERFQDHDQHCHESINGLKQWEEALSNQRPYKEPKH